MFAHSVDASTVNTDTDFFTSVNGTVDGGNVNCTWSRWDPACVNGSILCECDERDFDYVLLICVFIRGLCVILTPLFAIYPYPDLLDRPRIENVLIFLSPFVYPVLRPFLPENKIIENVLYISVPSILQGALFFYLSVMFLFTSNFASKRIESLVLFDKYYAFYEIHIKPSFSVSLMAFLLLEAVGILEVFNAGISVLPGQHKAITSMGKRQDPLFYPNVFMFRKLVLLTQIVVLVVFTVDRVRKEVNTHILNKQIFVAQIITLLTWNFGAFVTLLGLWELWPIFVFLTVAEPFLFWALATAFYDYNKRIFKIYDK